MEVTRDYVNEQIRLVEVEVEKADALIKQANEQLQHAQVFKIQAQASINALRMVLHRIEQDEVAATE